MGSGQDGNEDIGHVQKRYGADQPEGRNVQFHPQELTPFPPQKKKQRPLTAEERALKKKQADINATTRWLADSSFTTYFGKPPFHAYGKGNVKPTNLNSKFLTHNINAATGSYTVSKGGEIEADNQKAIYQQVYDSALLAGLERTGGTRVPKLPRKGRSNMTVGDEPKPKGGKDIMPNMYENQRSEAA